MFRVPTDNHPAEIAARLLKLPEHQHLLDGEARIEWLMRLSTKRKFGRDILGTCYTPSVQGDLKPLFDWLMGQFFGGDEPVDFLIILDDAYWEDATPREREILVYHELLHATQAIDKHGEPRFDRETGRPVWSIRPHDVEEFTETVARYGAWNEDLKRFIAAVSHGSDTVVK